MIGWEGSGKEVIRFEMKAKRVERTGYDEIRLEMKATRHDEMGSDLN